MSIYIEKKPKQTAASSSLSELESSFVKQGKFDLLEHVSEPEVSDGVVLELPGEPSKRGYNERIKPVLRELDIEASRIIGVHGFEFKKDGKLIGILKPENGKYLLKMTGGSMNDYKAIADSVVNEGYRKA